MLLIKNVCIVIGTNSRLIGVVSEWSVEEQQCQRKPWKNGIHSFFISTMLKFSSNCNAPPTGKSMVYTHFL